jgi:hypothetical protein
MAASVAVVLSETVSGVLNKCFSAVQRGKSTFSIFPLVALLRIRFSLASDRCGIICCPDYYGDDSVCCRVNGIFLIVLREWYTSQRINQCKLTYISLRNASMKRENKDFAQYNLLTAHTLRAKMLAVF